MGWIQSFYFLYKGNPNVNGTLFHSFSATWMALFQITMGNYDVSIAFQIELYIYWKENIFIKLLTYIIGKLGYNVTKKLCHKTWIFKNLMTLKILIQLHNYNSVHREVQIHAQYIQLNIICSLVLIVGFICLLIQSNSLCLWKCV